MEFDTALPALVLAANRLPYDYAEGLGIDFEPFDAFLSPAETARWFRAWTGDPGADAGCFRVFGQDGSGGYVAFWCVHEDAELTSQPVVFLGSEGEVALLASHFKDYLWLLAAGMGPCEAASYPGESEVPQPPLMRFAQDNAAPFKAWDQVLADASAEFPDFKQFIALQIRH